MKNNISTILSQPYPFFYNNQVKWSVAGILFLMTFLFGYLFEPFEVYVPEHKMNYLWIALIHSLTPATIVASFFTLPTTQTIEENWNIGKELFLIILFLLTVGMVQFLIRDIIYDNPNNWSLWYFYEEIRNTILVGGLFAAILIPLNYISLITKNQHVASTLNQVSQSTPPTLTTVESPVLVKIEDLQININNLIFAKAEGNYVSIHLIDDQNSKLLKRIVFKELETLLKPHANILKTHRSYLVNLHHVKRITGNAQGYKLTLNNCNIVIPVSRNMISLFNQRTSHL